MIPFNQTLQAIVERAGQLYSLPVVAMEVLDLTNHPQVDVAALASAVENDPALTSKILKAVNSSLFGLSCPVVDLNQALSLLGTKPLKLLVLGFSLPEKLLVGVARDVLAAYWRRALTRAIASREISQTIWNLPGDEAFIAGLLADLGELVLIRELGEPYLLFLGKVREQNGDLAVLEREALGFHRTQLTASLLKQWGMPESIVRVIAIPKVTESLRRLPGCDAAVPQILHLAELIAGLVAEHRIAALPELLEAGRAYHGITRDTITDLVGQLGEKISLLAEVLTLDLADGMNYRDLLIEAHRRLSEVASDAATDLIRCQREEADAYEVLLSECEQLSQAVLEIASPEVGLLVRDDKLNLPSTAAGSDRGKEFAHAEPGPEISETIVTSLGQGYRGLLAILKSMVANSREQRQELTLLLAEIDRGGISAVSGSPLSPAKATSLLEVACRALDCDDLHLIPVDEARFAMIVPDCDRRLAVQLSLQLVRGVRRLGQHEAFGESPATSVSVGAATLAAAAKNFPPNQLLESAERCLFGAQASGGNMVKSIEIY